MSDELREFLARARGTAATAKVLPFDELRAGREQITERWGLAAMRGRLVELSARGATATLTTAIEIVVEAQIAAEPVAWITLGAGTFYPPDAADGGVDLAALVVVRAPDAAAAARAAEKVLRSGAFGLVVLDLGDAAVPTAHQGRLVTLAQAHDAAVVCLTEKTAETASIGSLVSLRAEALRARGPGGFDVKVRVIKDKRTGPGFTRSSAARPPAGFK
jgi:recombination protein RecA